MKLKKYEWAALAAALLLVLAAAIVHFSRRSAPAEFVFRAAPQHSAVSTEDAEAQKIDINRAGRGTLCALDGIGEVLAERIIAYREEHGAFARIEDITNVQGIGSATFEKICGCITVG